MASSDNSKSISGSQSIQFSKASTDAFSDMTAFSPPADSWVIRYPRRDSQVKKEEPKRSVPKASSLEDPCRKYIDGSEIPVKSNKSLGTDDHFKSAVCSKNLLKVCDKLMSSREFVNVNDTVEDDFEELSLMNEKSRMEFYRKRHGNRRGSKSLPGSPKMERKNIGAESQQAVVSHNPYFTISKTAERKESNISFLTNLFGITAVQPAEAKTNLTQKFEHETKTEMKHVETTESAAAQPRKLLPKPHEYRDLNIFSPTSM